MKEGWDLLPLGKVCSYDKSRNVRFDIPYVGLEHIESNTGKYLGDYNPIQVKSTTFYFTPSHVLYGRLRPYLNKVLIPDFEGHCSTEIFPIIPSKNLLRKYLFYWLIMDTTVSKIDATWTGARMPRANMKEVLNFHIPIPPLPEQKQIVAILDQAFEAIDQAKANIEKNIENAKELFQSKLNEIFSQKGEGWEEKRLGELCHDMQYGTSNKAVVSGEVVVLRMGNIQNGKIDWKDLKYSIDQDDIKKYILEPGDVLFNRTNSPEHVGKCAIYNGELPAIFAGYLIKINRKRELIDGEFLNYIMNSKRIREYGYSVMSSSVNQANINASKLKEYIIPYTDFIAQKSIVDKLKKLESNIQELIGRYNEKSLSIEKLKKSILQKAFSGELTKDYVIDVEDSLSMAAESRPAYSQNP